MPVYLQGLFHTDWNQEDRSIYRHSRQTRYNRTPPQKELAANQNVRHERKQHEDQVSKRSISRLHNLKVSMTSRRILLDLTRQDGEHQNLDSSTGRVPKGASDTVRVGHRGGLKQCGGPCPCGDDTRGNETRLDRTRGSIEFFGLVGGVLSVAILKVRYEHHQKREEESDANHDTYIM